MQKSRLIVFCAILYTAGIFFTSDKTLRIMSMTLCNFVSIAMLVILFMRWGAGKFKFFSSTPIAMPLAAAILWAGISLLFSRINPDTAISPDAYLYAWATGINSPAFRGISFFVRLGLAIAAFSFLYQAVDSLKTYKRIIKTFSWGYIVFCTITLAQIILYHFFSYSFGQLFVDSLGRMRIGSYVGEPSVMSALLASGYFLFSPFFKPPADWPTLPKFARWYGFIAASVALFYAMSAAVILAIILAYMFAKVKNIRSLVVVSSLAFLLVITPSVIDRFLDNPLITKVQTELTTVTIRSLSWLIGYNMLLAAPLTGVGIGQFPFFIEQQIPTDVEINFDLKTSFDYTAIRHTAMNTYLEWIAETGIIGGGVLIWVIVAGYRAQNRFKGVSVTAVRKTFGMALIALLISANSFPGAFYLSHLVFVVAMYFAGLRVYADVPISAGKQSGADIELRRNS